MADYKISISNIKDPGTIDGIELPAGSYYYRIDLDGNDSVDFEGWLYLTR